VITYSNEYQALSNEISDESADKYALSRTEGVWFMFDLTGRVALVTGGNGGIGLAMAQGLAEAGASIAIIGRDAEKGMSAVRSIGSEKAKFFAADVTDEKSAQDAVARAADGLGRIDILVNNAGIAIRKSPQDYTLQEWNKVLDTNLTSAFIMSNAVYGHMLSAQGGKIINIASILANFGAPFSVAYSASKGGLVQFTKALATAWAPDNIQVNAILPGWVNTDLTVSARSEVDGLHETVMKRTPAKRWGSPSDFAGAAVFFASGASDFVTGASLLIDGGYSAQV
jgi:2-deoxy-D-gluconate 3-dehydrogenase